jgi:hypothetical protein
VPRVRFAFDGSLSRKIDVTYGRSDPSYVSGVIPEHWPSPGYSPQKLTVRRVSVLVLLLIAAYSIFVAVRASFFTTGHHGSVFWTAIGMLVVVAAAALWGAGRLRRHS